MRDGRKQFLDVVYFTPTPLEKNGGFWPVRLGLTIAKPNYYEGPRYVVQYALHFVLEGNGTFMQDNHMYSLKPGDLFCLFPNISHEYFTDKDRLLKMIWLAFDGKQALQILNRIGLRPYSPYLPDAISEEIAQQLERLHGYFREPDHIGQDFLRHSAFFRLFHMLEASAVGRYDERSNSVSWLRKGLEYLEMNYTEGITIEQAAKFVGVDRSHFSKQFRKQFGISPSEYLHSLIMKEAGQLAQKSDYSFTEIALSTGFPDLYSFSKAFKKYYNMTPTMFRAASKAPESASD